MADRDFAEATRLASYLVDIMSKAASTPHVANSALVCALFVTLRAQGLDPYSTMRNLLQDMQAQKD